MVSYLSVITSLLLQPWYLALVALVAFLIHHFSKPEAGICGAKTAPKANIWLLAFLGFLIFLILSPAYWMFGDNAAHGFSDDIAHTLQTYLSSYLRGNSINWTNGLAGGMDRWQLPNCYPYSLGRIYALFLHKPYQLYLMVIIINVITVFIFTWKIQTEMWQMRPWAAYIGAVIVTIIEGYWTGKYPDAHISNGHGFAVIIAGIYWLTRFYDHPKFWLVAVVTGALMAIGSWTPFHNLPPLLITIGIWGLVFWGKGSWIKIIKANALIVLTLMLILLPYFLAIKLLFPTTGRIAVFRPTVDLTQIYHLPPIIALAMIGLLGAILKIYRQQLVRQVLIIYLGFSLLPLLAYGMEISKIAPFFRWELLFAGNDAFSWLAVIFFVDKIQQEIKNRSFFAGIASKVLIISLAWVVIIFAWMGSLWMDLISSYPEGNWKYLTDTSVSSVLKKIDPQPVRVVGIDDTHDMHFWGQYQGMEPLLVYTPFIDRRKTFFWWYSAMFVSLHGAYTAAWLSIPVPVKGHEHNFSFPIPLPALVNLDALRVANVRWIVSRHPLYPMPDLKTVLAQPGQPAACQLSYGPPSRVDFQYLDHFWKNVACIVKDYSYPRSLYVYYLQGTLPRVYMATHILPWPSGQPPILSQLQLKIAAQGAAFIDLNQWILYQTQGSSGKVTIDDYQSDYLRLKLEVQKDSLVVVSSSLNPYWRVLVDGKKTDDFDVNGFQNGFWVSPGAHQAELIYCPPFRPAQHPYCSKSYRAGGFY